MSTFQIMKENATRLRREINEILKMNREELYGEKRLHGISFNHYGKKQFEMVFGLIEDLSKCHFDRIPDIFISPILQRLKIYKEIFKMAENLNLTNDISPKSTRDQIVRKIENNYSNFFNEASKIISFANQSGTDFKRIEKEARQTLESVKTHAEEKNKQIGTKIQEADAILEAMRSASAETGVSQNAIHYSNAQKNHAEQAQKWYKLGKQLLLGLGIATLMTSIIFVWLQGQNPPIFGYLEIATLIITSLWIYAVNFCNKNFHSEKHNEMINACKAKTLTTFRSFVEATEDEHIKNQILLHAGASVFSNPSTGFGKNQSPPLPPGVELIKQVANNSTERA